MERETQTIRWLSLYRIEDTYDKKCRPIKLFRWNNYENNKLPQSNYRDSFNVLKCVPYLFWLMPAHFFAFVRQSRQKRTFTQFSYGKSIHIYVVSTFDEDTSTHITKNQKQTTKKHRHTQTAGLRDEINNERFLTGKQICYIEERKKLLVFVIVSLCDVKLPLLMTASCFFSTVVDSKRYIIQLCFKLTLQHVTIKWLVF